MIISGTLPSDVVIFSEIVLALQDDLKRNMAQIRFLLNKNPGMGYTRIVEIGREVGKRYGIKLIVNFPKEGRIEEFEMYGRRDLSLIVDYEKKRFPMDREIIKKKATDTLGNVKTQDAYMYEKQGGCPGYTQMDWKIDILPHSLHIWTEFDDGVTAFCDWLMDEVYQVKRR